MSGRLLRHENPLCCYVASGRTLHQNARSFTNTPRLFKVHSPVRFLAQHPILGADRGSQVDGLRAAKHLLGRGGAVASGVARRAIKEHAAVAGRQDVVLVGERIAVLGAELV